MKKIKIQSQKKTSDAVAILDRMMGNDPKARQLLEEARINLAVAQLIYDARAKAGLTQKELAKRVGTTQSVIARLEDADYEGRSLTMLNRIAAALSQSVRLRFVPINKKAA